MALRKGSTLLLTQGPVIRSFAAVGSKMEGEGPLGPSFDLICEDSAFGQDSWEKAEASMQKKALDLAIQKGAFSPEEIDVLFAGDLLNQCISSTYGLRYLNIPFLGVYGACSTMAESLMMASLFVEGGFGELAGAVTSSHFCSAERQFRFPLEYGSQRPPSAQWTATASGAVVVGRQGTGPRVRAVTPGRIRDLGITDANNMGAAMAPAAADTISRFFTDTGYQPEDFDLVVTGDLAHVGSQLLLQLLERDGVRLEGRHRDCGLLLYDRKRQQVDSGGSGCGCSASVLCSSLLPRLLDGSLRNILFVATGALMSPTAVQQGESIPGIAHLLWLSAAPAGKE